MGLGVTNLFPRSLYFFLLALLLLWLSSCGGTATLTLRQSIDRTSLKVTGMSDFGAVLAGGGHEERTFSITNQDYLTVTQLRPRELTPPYSYSGGAYPGVDRNGVHGTCASTLARGETCTIVISYDPIDNQQHALNLHFDYDVDPGIGILDYSITGKGINPASITMTAWPLMDFGESSLVGGTTRTIQLENTGDVTATDFGLTLPTKDPQDAVAAYQVVSNNCGATLEAGAHCTVNLKFTPSRLGAHTNQISMNYHTGLKRMDKTLSLHGSGVMSQQRFMGEPGTQSNYNYFGNMQALTSDTAVFSQIQGKAHVYVKNGTSWTLSQIIPGTQSSEQFATSVALDGSTLAIGAPEHYASGANAGGVYMYQRNSAGQFIFQNVVIANDPTRASYDNFGRKVVLYGDWMAVSAFGQSTDSTGGSPLYHAGAAYLFHRDSNGNWTQVKKFAPEGADRVAGETEQWFGESLALTNNMLIVGAFFHQRDAQGLNPVFRCGAVFVYSGPNWTLSQKLTGFGPNPRNDSDHFGYRVALDGDALFVSARAYDYDKNGNNYYGSAGLVFVFKYVNGQWVPSERIDAGDSRYSSPLFGQGLVKRNDTLFIGSHDRGFVYHYENASSCCTLRLKLDGANVNQYQYGNWFGYSAFLSPDASILAVSAPYAQIPETYDNGGVWLFW